MSTPFIQSLFRDHLHPLTEALRAEEVDFEAAAELANGLFEAIGSALGMDIEPVTIGNAMTPENAIGQVNAAGGQITTGELGDAVQTIREAFDAPEYEQPEPAAAPDEADETGTDDLDAMDRDALIEYARSVQIEVNEKANEKTIRKAIRDALAAALSADDGDEDEDDETETEEASDSTDATAEDDETEGDVTDDDDASDSDEDDETDDDEDADDETEDDETEETEEGQSS